ncbi:MAG TPA: hypothetical protein VMS17_16790 [Gemmataceae bacterium]|nr:hypothetical protein [Gemmataceae bacterium]
MAKTFDVVLKHLVEQYPAAWLSGVGWPPAGPVRVIDADVSTVSAGADKVFRVDEATPWIAHLELQAGPETELADRAHLYNVLLRRRHRVAVRSAIVLLRREADSPRLNGLLEHLDPAGDWERRWRYRVIRVWQLAADALLTGEMGLLPLAPLTDDAEERLRDVIHRLDERVQKEAPGEWGRTLESMSYWIMGLRYPRELVDELWKGVRGMEESSTYQATIEKGVEKGVKIGMEMGVEIGRKAALRDAILRQAARRLGAPPAEVVAALNGIEDVARLDRMFDRAPDAASWADLLATS